MMFVQFARKFPIVSSMFFCLILVAGKIYGKDGGNENSDRLNRR